MADAGATLPGVAATEHLVHALDACDVCSALHAAQVHGAEAEIAELRAALATAVEALREIAAIGTGFQPSGHTSDRAVDIARRAVSAVTGI